MYLGSCATLLHHDRHPCIDSRCYIVWSVPLQWSLSLIIIFYFALIVTTFNNGPHHVRDSRNPQQDTSDVFDSEPLRSHIPHPTSHLPSPTPRDLFTVNKYYMDVSIAYFFNLKLDSILYHLHTLTISHYRKENHAYTMINNVFLIVWACFQLVPCAATVNIQQKPSSGEYPYNTLVVDFSMLSESCANETIDVIRKSYDLQHYTSACWGTNETDGRCELGFDVVDYQKGCNASSGEFYAGLDVGNESLFVCGSNVDGKQYQREVAAIQYPFCAGISCNESEILMAYDAMLSADAQSGQLGEAYSSHCSFPSLSPPTSTPPSTSIAYNRYNGGSVMYIMLAMFSSILLLAL